MRVKYVSEAYDCYRQTWLRERQFRARWENYIAAIDTWLYTQGIFHHQDENDEWYIDISEEQYYV